MAAIGPRKYHDAYHELENFLQQAQVPPFSILFIFQKLLLSIMISYQCQFMPCPPQLVIFCLAVM